ncbi:MAG: transposase [Bacillota bacterium]
MTWAFVKGRRETKEGRILCKRCKELLWKFLFKLTEEQSRKVKDLLMDKPILHEAYVLKNKVDEWFKKSNKMMEKSWFRGMV